MSPVLLHVVLLYPIRMLDFFFFYMSYRNTRLLGVWSYQSYVYGSASAFGLHRQQSSTQSAHTH